MVLLFITSNQSKVRLATERLNKYKIDLQQKECEIIEPQVLDVEYVAKEKARQARNYITTSFIIEDSSLCINKLNGFPGALVKPVLDSIGSINLLKLIEEDNDRTVVIKSVLIYYDPKQNLTKIFTSTCDGLLAKSPMGKNNRGWKFADIYIPKGHTKTIAEMDDEEWIVLLDELRTNDHYEKFGIWFKNNVLMAK